MPLSLASPDAQHVRLGRRLEVQDASLGLELLPPVHRWGHAGALAPLRADGSPLPADELPGVSAMRQRRPAYVAFYMHDVEGHMQAIETTAIPLESSTGHVVGAFVVGWTPTSGQIGLADPRHVDEKG